MPLTTRWVSCTTLRIVSAWLITSPRRSTTIALLGLFAAETLAVSLLITANQREARRPDGAVMADTVVKTLRFRWGGVGRRRPRRARRARWRELNMQRKSR